MEHIDHFKSELISFDIDGIFEYKPLIAADSLEMDFSFCYIEVEGAKVFDSRRFNILKLATNLKKVPYSIETLKQITGKELDWPELEVEDRIKLILKLSKVVFEQILEVVNKVDNADSELKKNSKT